MMIRRYRTAEELQGLTPHTIRMLIRKELWDKPTTGIAMGYAQANLVILPEQYARDFLLFCQRNPKPCPVLEVLEPGKYHTKFLAKRADVRTDIPRYNVYQKGKLEATTANIKELWQEDFVAFLLGCSFSFEEALIEAGISVRHIEEKKNVPMYITNIACKPAGIFRGPLVVSMRPMSKGAASRAGKITSCFASVHGGPVHTGAPQDIGVKDLARPDFGDSVSVRKNEVPVFWACGVTPQAAVMRAKPEICITHAPGYMFISDVLNENLSTM
jgi:uncharacterized protein YcsI (UPF0317 family)